MSASYRAVHWTRSKIAYDFLIAAGVGGYIAIFMWTGSARPGDAHAITPDILRIRAFGTCALLMLTITLSIGPLARLDRRFLPLLYNRRHLGVLTFCVALAHAYLVLDWYHG